MQTKPPLEDLMQRIRARSSEGYKPKPEAQVKPKAYEAKAKEPKPMTMRTTKNHTGLEDYTNIQLTGKLSNSTTMQDVYRCYLELQNRFSKYRETVGNICLEALNRLEVEYQKYHQQNGGQTGFYEPDPEPEPEPPPPPPPLTWEIITAIEANDCPYGPYIMEIWESDWDYVDRRVNNKKMDATPDKAKDWAYTHKDDTGTRADISDSQYGLMIVMLKAYLYHKRHPSVQAAAANPPW